MHEMSIMGNILDIILEYAEKNNAKKIKQVNLTIGVLADVIPEWAQTYFDMLSKDTIADNAVLNIDKVPAKIQCRACSHEYSLEKGEFNFVCKKCESGDIELLSGRELNVSSIEIE